MRVTKLLLSTAVTVSCIEVAVSILDCFFTPNVVNFLTILNADSSCLSIVFQSFVGYDLQKAAMRFIVRFQ